MQNIMQNRAQRRLKAFKKRIPSLRYDKHPRPTKVMERGAQDSAQSIFKLVHTPYKTKSAAGVSYTHYKQFVVYK